MAYRSPLEIRVGLVANPDTPPFSNRHHPVSCIAPFSRLVNDGHRETELYETPPDSLPIPSKLPTRDMENGDLAQDEITLNLLGLSPGAIDGTSVKSSTIGIN